MSGRAPEELRAQSRRYWDADAEALDRAVAEDVATRAQRAAWRSTLAHLLPPAPARILDAGAGSGFLSLIAARLGHRVTALDFSPAMLDLLRAAAAREGLEIDAVEADAHRPPTGPFDAVMERNVLWNLLDPTAALDAWRAAAPTGRLLCFEGAWGTGGGAQERRRQRLREAIARRRGTGAAAPPAHHAPFPAAVGAQLAHGAGLSERAAAALVRSSAWRSARSLRLRRVELALRPVGGPADWLLGVTPRYVVVGDEERRDP